MRLLVTVFFILLSSCATVSESIFEAKYYRRDIELKVNGVEGVGVLVIPQAERYKIEGKNRGAFDFLEIRSCHRQHLAEKEGDSFKYEYVPVKGIEDNRACPLEIRGIEHEKSRDSFGFVDFRSPRDQLPATLECNGVAAQVTGVSVCSAPLGLIQKIKFNGAQVVASVRPVDAQTKAEDCASFPTQGLRMEIEFKVPRGQCQVIFMESGGSNRTHRMTVLGYEDSIMRSF